MREVLIALLAAVAPGLNFLKTDQAPPPPDPNSTLKLLIMGSIFVITVGGAISSMLSPYTGAGAKSKEQPK